MSARWKKNKKYRERIRFAKLKDKWGNLPKVIIMDLERQEFELKEQGKWEDSF